MGSASQLSQSTSAAMCEPFLKQFMRCMDANFNEASACQSIMDQLKACRGEPSQVSTSFAGGY